MDERYNTMYTHMLTRPTSQLTGTPQGPHTVAHSLVSYGIQQVTSQDDWDRLEELFDTQVPHSDDIEALLTAELPAKVLSSNKIRASLARYRDDYMVLYGNIMWSLENPEEADYDDTLAAIREIMELHPYQTYAWKSGKRASKRSTQGKNESMYLREFKTGKVESLKGLMDTSRVRFNDSKQFVKFLRLRLSMVASEAEIDQLLQ